MNKKMIVLILVLGLLWAGFSGFLVSGRSAIVTTTSVDGDSGCGVEWHRTYGGEIRDGGYCVQQTYDGGYIITGITYSFGIGQSDVWLIKTDEQGNMVWNKTFDGGHPEKLIIDCGVYVLQTDDDGDKIKDDGFIVLADMCEIYICLIKTDAQGNMEWNKSFNRRRFSEPHCMRQTSDGGYIIVGYTSWSKIGSAKDTWLIKTDAMGNMEWNRTYDRSNWDEGYGVQQTSDGGYIVVGGNLGGPSGYCSVYLFKTNATGVMKWEKTFHRPEVDDIGYSIQQTSNGDYIIVGSALFKTDANGNELWHKPIEGKCVQQTTDGGYIIAGTKDFKEMYGHEDLNIVKTDAEGTIEWEQSFGGAYNDRGSFVQQTPDGGYIVLGRTSSFTPGEFNDEIWLIKLGEKPTLKITKISGGLGISAVVKNTGTQDLSALDWSINLDGKLSPSFENVFFGREKEGVISSLPVGDEARFRNRFVLGIGPGIIQARAGIVIRAANCFLFGPFVFRGRYK